MYQTGNRGEDSMVLRSIRVRLGVGFAIGAWDGNTAIRGKAPTNWMILLGVVSGFGCVVRNRAA
jgi:hypothetical protein